MDLRGQRFTIDLSDDEDETGSDSRIPFNDSSSIPGAFIGDIQERSSTDPPSAPKLKTTTSGFPEHKKRTRVSTFKQQRGGYTVPAARVSKNEFASPHTTAVPATDNNRNDIEEEERRQIDEENNRRLASMSTAEIDEERQELMASLDPSLIERLLKRANLDQGRGDTGVESPSAKAIKNGEEKQSEATQGEEGATRASKPRGRQVIAAKGVSFEDDTAPEKPIDLRPVSEIPSSAVPEILEPSIHFPTASSAPELDPSDPDFFENLHTKYFPSLPADPSKLAWMAPIPTDGSLADQDSPYYPGLDALPVSAIRFGFKGGILPPRIARAVPVKKGLHHHGEAPEAAGYTIPELARLSRSAFPSQRCIAFQTFGRILYRLGRGVFQQGSGTLEDGIWKCLEESKVLQTLEEAASAEGGHQASKAHAIQALWLWQKGGGKVWRAS